MRSLTRRLTLRPVDDRGVVGIVVGMLIGFGVLVGIAALAIDVGMIYHERAQLQNAADAGALGVARTCVGDGCDESIADHYANANSRDDVSTVELVCGVDDDGVLPACPESNGTITDCPELPSEGNYVDVHTTTLTGGGSSLLPAVFAQTIVGNEDYEGKNVNACARASWGGPGSMETVAMTISFCEWDQATAGGTSFPAPPPYPPNPLPDKSYDQQLKLHTTTENTACPSGPSGYDGPGAFGWVDDDDGDCQAFVDGDSYEADTGVSAGNSCKDLLKAAQENRTLLYIPVYRYVDGTGTNTTYALEGFAAFVVTGFHLPGLNAGDWLNPALNCKGADKCINGYFTEPLQPKPGRVGGPDLGVRVVQLTG